MPTVTVTNVLTEAQALLNDVAGAIYTQAVMLPFINKAYDEAQNYLIDNGVQVLNEISATVDIPTGTLSIDPQVAIATTFIEPAYIQERADGSVSEDDWVDMEERRWEPSESQQSTLDVWTWREQTIKFRGATTNREIRVFYHKSLAVFSAGADVVGIERAKTFLAARAASIAALVIGENVTRSEALDNDANTAKETLLSINAKKAQAVPMRRRRFRRPRRNALSI